MSDKLPEHLTKGGPGDKFLGDGKIDTSTWFEDPHMDGLVGPFEKQVKDQDIFFCGAPFQLLFTDIKVIMHHALGLDQQNLALI